ncbi:unnamed protein product [Amoebophrya sp. A25]|nr:unnamed protein product [Amoebophrya sp. A25]|eukprot:GSA25T00022325001.1
MHMHQRQTRIVVLGFCDENYAGKFFRKNSCSRNQDAGRHPPSTQ